jgi:hypothetical protein
MKTRVLLPALLLLIALPALASSVLQVTFDELVRSSEFVFEGRVVNKRAEFDKRGSIKTYVTFEVMDVYKGAYSGRTLQLPFLGGTVGDLTMKISDLEAPDIGETGIYFVESMSNPPAHPLYGWDQGHFLVRTNQADRTDHVLSHTGKPVSGCQAAGKAAGLSNGVAAGLTLDADRASQGLTVVQFKQKIKELLNTR